MQDPPRRPDEGILSRSTGVHVAWVGAFMGGLSIGTQAWAISAGAHWQTMVFTVLTLAQLFHVMGIRLERETLFGRGFFANPALLWAVVLTCILQMAAIYAPFLNGLLKT